VYDFDFEIEKKGYVNLMVYDEIVYDLCMISVVECCGFRKTKVMVVFSS
jgi:hypothetical protein